FSRPCCSATSAIASITPSPRWRSSSPSRTKSGSHPSALTVPSLRSRAGAVTTGRQNTAISPAAGTPVPAVNVSRPRERRPQARATSGPAGVPASMVSTAWLAQRRQADKNTQGLLGRARTRHPNAYQEPPSRTGPPRPGESRQHDAGTSRRRARHCPDHYADRVASKKRRSGKGKGPRRGISGNPQRRAGQLAQRRPAIAGEPDLPPLVLDFRSEKPDDARVRALALAGAAGAEPRPWWADSHQGILPAARALPWPARLVDLETQACQIVGDEFDERLNLRLTGLHPPQWLRALVEETGAALRASVASGTGDWRELGALLCGLARTAPPRGAGRGGPQLG